MSDDAITVQTDSPDLDALLREARRDAVVRVPVVDVRVSFRGREEPVVWGTWRGQVYGSLAVVKIGEEPPGVFSPDHRDLRGWQLVHVPTGRFIETYWRPGPLRALALGLGRCIDWSRVDGDTLGPANRSAIDGVLTAWRWRYGFPVPDDGGRR